MSMHNSGPPAFTPEGSIPADCVAVAADHQVWAQLGEETMILHVPDGIYYGLDAVGASIWSLLQQPRTVAEIRDRICAEYEVEPDQCERELILLLQQLAERRLIDLSPLVART